MGVAGNLVVRCAKLNKLVKLRGNVGVVYEVIIWESIGQMYGCAKKQRRQDSIGPAATNISNPKNVKVQTTVGAGMKKLKKLKKIVLIFIKTHKQNAMLQMEYGRPLQ